MTVLKQDASSFRDPAGVVYQDGNNIYRTVMPQFAEEFSYIRQSGLIDQLIADNDLLPEIIIDNNIDANAAYILQHPKLDFISYPYEWCFSALKSAALLHLKIHLRALEFDVTLVDASSYNIQFIGSKPIFIDHLSFKKYSEGNIWLGHRQFCQQFLNPLLLQAYCGISFNDIFRGQPEGISPSTIRNLLPFHRKWLPNVFLHVMMQTSLAKTPIKEVKTNINKFKLPKQSLIRLLRGMQDTIANLKIRKTSSPWQNYVDNHSYSQASHTEKTLTVKQFVETVKPQLLIDLGCNIGEYAQIALKHGANHVIGCDSDAASIERGFVQAETTEIKFLPLIINIANPSPAQGFKGLEYKSFNNRAKPDALLALAILHHLIIQNNLPMVAVLNWITDLAPQGLIEFIPKSDRMVQDLLLLRDDIFTDYTENKFMGYLTENTRIIQKINFTGSERFMVWYERIK